MLRGVRMGSKAFGFRVYRDPPTTPLIYPKYPLLRTMRALLKGTWGVLVGLAASLYLRLKSSLPDNCREFE